VIGWLELFGGWQVSRFSELLEDETIQRLGVASG
jgi:hypothetical protein